MGNYALFLKNVRHDHDRAQELYERAMIVDADDAENVGNYARFLATVRHDHGRAQELYERALAADPDNADILGNYAGFLYSWGRPGPARELVTRLRALPAFGDEQHGALRLEISFYVLANGGMTPDQCRSTVEGLRRELAAGRRSPGWSFAANIDRARLDGAGDAELEFLVALAAVINDEARLERLERFEEWRSAGR